MKLNREAVFQGDKLEVLEMTLKNKSNQLELSWKVCFNNTPSRITFCNVSCFQMGEVSSPLEIHGFEIINHSQEGWDKCVTYEIRDFEDSRVSFFCEDYEVDTSTGDG